MYTNLSYYRICFLKQCIQIYLITVFVSSNNVYKFILLPYLFPQTMYTNLSYYRICFLKQRIQTIGSTATIAPLLPYKAFSNLHLIFLQISIYAFIPFL